MLDCNKVAAYNTFAVPIITPSVGVLNWTTNDIKQIDIKTRKILTIIGNFHPISDIDKLYCDKKSGGRGLRSIKIIFESRLVALRQHLTHSENRNEIMHYIHEQEIDNILRVANDLINNQNIEDNDYEHPRKISRKYIKMCRKNLNDLFIYSFIYSLFYVGDIYKTH